MLRALVASRGKMPLQLKENFPGVESGQVVAVASLEQKISLRLISCSKETTATRTQLRENFPTVDVAVASRGKRPLQVLLRVN